MNEEQYNSVVSDMRLPVRSPDMVTTHDHQPPCLPSVRLTISTAGYSALTPDSRLVTQNDGVLFGLPVVMDTRDDSVAVGDKILLTYQVRRGHHLAKCSQRASKYWCARP